MSEEEEINEPEEIKEEVVEAAKPEPKVVKAPEEKTTAKASVKKPKKTVCGKHAPTKENFPDEKKSAYRRNIFNFLNSNEANRYRSTTYANLLIKAIL